MSFHFFFHYVSLKQEIERKNCIEESTIFRQSIGLISMYVFLLSFYFFFFHFVPFMVGILRESGKCADDEKILEHFWFFVFVSFILLFRLSVFLSIHKLNMYVRCCCCCFFSLFFFSFFFFFSMICFVLFYEV